jgi:hypothetical protein
MAANEEALDSLKRAMDITSCARFQANLRLSARERQSSYVISLLSTFVILLSLIPNVTEVSTKQSQTLLACSIVVSVFIIFTSLLETTGNFHHRAELLHQSARGIVAVLNDVRLLSPHDPNFPAELIRLRQAYRDTLEACPFNHERVDYVYARVERPDLFPQFYADKGFIYALQRLGDHFSYLFRLHGWLLPHVLVVAATVYVVKMYVFPG